MTFNVTSMSFNLENVRNVNEMAPYYGTCYEINLVNGMIEHKGACTPKIYTMNVWQGIGIGYRGIMERLMVLPIYNLAM